LTLILASTSPIRRQMLAGAGVDVEPISPDVDETPLKALSDDPVAVAAYLAKAKAVSVAADPGDWVIGSDSVVSVGGRLFSKPADRRAAGDHLRSFSGKPMRLTSAAALARGNRVEWSHVETAKLQVRELSDSFIESYLAAEWPEVGYCVGVFRMEGRGVQLFDRIDGDYFTILGMPLIPLLAALRDRGVIPR
jgi:septum formation protein